MQCLAAQLGIVTFSLALLLTVSGGGDARGSKELPARARSGAAAKKPGARRIPAKPPKSKTVLQKEKATLRRQMAQTRAALKRKKRQERKVSEEIRESQQNLEVARSNLRVTRARLAYAERDLADARTRLSRARARLSAHIRLLRGRLVDIYKHGSVSYAVVLLQSRDVWDLTSRGTMLRRVVRHDVDLVDRIKVEKAEIAAQTRRLAARRNDVARLRMTHECQVATVTQCLADQRQILSEVSRDRARIEAALAELEENSREVERMLRAFEARPDITRRIPHPWSGSFSRPVAGRITSGFGMRYHPVLHVTKLHTGVDIAAATGTPIAAAGDGVVVHAGWWGGYGNCIVLAHGNGRSTLYGHCSSVAVSVGQQVCRGQTIGRVGSTGYSTGPHLHFEVRLNGSPVNPMSR